MPPVYIIPTGHICHAMRLIFEGMSIIVIYEKKFKQILEEIRREGRKTGTAAGK